MGNRRSAKGGRSVTKLMSIHSNGPMGLLWLTLPADTAAYRSVRVQHCFDNG